MRCIQFTKYCSRYTKYLNEQNGQKFKNLCAMLSEYFANFLEYYYIQINIWFFNIKIFN